MKHIKKLAAFITIAIMLNLPSYAIEPYTNYIYDSNNNPQEEPQAYLPETIINGKTLGITELNGPADIFVAHDNKIYILDSGNNRLIILKNDFTVEKIIDKLDNNGKVDSFNNPQGIYVTKSNEIFVADTDNSRVISFDYNGKVRFNLGKPETNRLQGDYRYQPVKVAVDKTGRIFVVSLNFNQGIIEYDKNGNFISFFGAVRTVADVKQIFWRFVAQYVPSIKSQIIKNIPTEYSSIAIDDKDFIMATVGIVNENNDKNYIKRLNLMGNDVLRRYDKIIPNGDVNMFSYNEKTGKMEQVFPRLCDIAVRENGIYSVLDYNTGRVFTYSFNGELMYVFGGVGTKLGQTGQPCALDVVNGDHYLVVDNKYNQILMYKPTTYGSIISKAVGEFYLRNYEAAGLEWKKALSYTSKSRLVYNGYAKSLFQMKDVNGKINCTLFRH